MNIFFTIMIILTMGLSLGGNFSYYFLIQKHKKIEDYRTSKYYLNKALIAEGIGAGGTLALILMLILTIIVFN